VPWTFQLAAGRASALFAVLAGLSLVLVGGRQPLRGQAWTGMAAGTLVRSAIVGFVGLLIGELDTGIAVILCYYAFFFVVALPFLALTTRVLVVVTVVWILLAPALSLYLRRGLEPTSYDIPSFEMLALPGTLLGEILVTGYYPVLTWMPFLLTGIVIGRMDLRSARTTKILAVTGGAAVLVSVLVSDLLLARPGVRSTLIATYDVSGWRGDLDSTLTRGLYGVVPTGSPWWLAVRAPHSGTTFELLMNLGSAALVLAGCLLLGRLLPRVSQVVFGAGTITLSLYTLHVLLRTRGFWDGKDLETFLGQAALVLLIGALFRWGAHRGPLEVLVGEPSAGVRRLVGGRR